MSCAVVLPGDSHRLQQALADAATVELELWDRDITKPDDPLGKVSIPLDAVRAANHAPVQGWHPVMHNGSQHGEIHVRLQVLPPVAPVVVAPPPAATTTTTTTTTAAAASISSDDVVDPAHVALQPPQSASAVIQETRSALEQRGVNVDKPAGETRVDVGRACWSSHRRRCCADVWRCLVGGRGVLPCTLIRGRVPRCSVSESGVAERKGCSW